MKDDLKKEVIGQKCYQLVHGLDAPIEGCSCTKMIDDENGASSEIKDRGRIYITTSSPIYGKNDELVSFAHTVKDITERKKEELALKSKSDMLENEFYIMKHILI